MIGMKVHEPAESFGAKMGIDSGCGKFMVAHQRLGNGFSVPIRSMNRKGMPEHVTV
jgi:hypothetical protein